MNSQFPQKTLNKNPDTAWDRLAFLSLGAISGALYGALMWVFIFVFTAQQYPGLIPWFALVFGCMGIFFGNVIVNAVLALMHLLLGILVALNVGIGDELDYSGNNPFRAFLLIGIGTGLAFMMYWQLPWQT